MTVKKQMKSIFKRFLKIVEFISSGLLMIAILSMLIFFGRFFLDLFGVLSYDPPLYKDGGKITRVELLLSTDSQKTETVAELEGEELELFLNDFSDVRFKRYANDPPDPYGERIVAVYYEDGTIDYIGEDMNQRFDSTGQVLSVKGWYYCLGNAFRELFQKYTIQTQ